MALNELHTYIPGYEFCIRQSHYCMYTMFYLLLSVVISEPDDATVCEGRSTTFTCVLDANHIIRNDSDVQWYRLIKDTGTTEMVDPQGRNIHFTTTPTTNDTALTTTLTITNATKSYTGYYWVRTPSDDGDCNVSLTVTGM